MYRLLVYAFLSFFFFSCAANETLTAEKFLQQESEANALLSPEEQYRKSLAHQAFLRGLDFLQKANHEAALVFYAQAAELAPQDRFLQFELAKLYLSIEQSDKALESARRGMLIKETRPSRLYSHNFLVAQIHFTLTNNDSAIYYYQKAFTHQEPEAEDLLSYSYALQAAENYSELAKAYQKLLPLLGYTPTLVQKQLLLCSMLQDDPCYEKNVKEAWEYQKTEENAKQLIGYYVKKKNNEALMPLMEEYLSLFPSEENEKLLIFLQSEQGERQKALQRAQNLWNSGDKLDMELLSLLMQLEFAERQMDSLITHADIMERLDSLDNSSFYYRTFAYMYKENYAEAIHNCKSYLQRKADNFHMQKTLMRLYGLNKQWNMAEKTMQEYSQTFTDSIKIWEFQESFYRFAGGRYFDLHPSNAATQDSAKYFYEQSQKITKKMLAKDSTNSDYLFHMALTHDRLGNRDSAHFYFETIIKIYPDHHQALNYYAYILIERDHELKRSGPMIDKALSLNPQSSAYLDTKAWWFYYNKEYDKALEMMLSIPENNRKSWEHLEHLALIYEALKEPEKAQEYWRELKNIYPDHHLLPQYLK
jgi:tetratricopeptide (TPR) repeat protein